MLKQVLNFEALNHLLPSCPLYVLTARAEAANQPPNGAWHSWCVVDELQSALKHCTTMALSFSVVVIDTRNT